MAEIMHICFPLKHIILPPPHPSYVHVYMYEQCKVVSVAQ